MGVGRKEEGRGVRSCGKSESKGQEGNVNQTLSIQPASIQHIEVTKGRDDAIFVDIRILNITGLYENSEIQDFFVNANTTGIRRHCNGQEIHGPSVF